MLSLQAFNISDLAPSNQLKMLSRRPSCRLPTSDTKINEYIQRLDKFIRITDNTIENDLKNTIETMENIREQYIIMRDNLIDYKNTNNPERKRELATEVFNSTLEIFDLGGMVDTITPNYIGDYDLKHSVHDMMTDPEIYTKADPNFNPEEVKHWC
jgi:hypothetical protein